MSHHYLYPLAKFIIAGLLVSFSSACSSGERATMSTVSSFEVNRYLGEWHQVAAIPAWFQNDCAEDTTAHYAIGEDDLIVVINSCDQANGQRKKAEARARFLGDSTDARLEVTFVNVLGYWLWLAAGDYWIIGLDPEYRWAVVGSPSREFAWILARAPSLDQQTIREVVQILRRESYDPCALIMTTPEHSSSLCDLAK